MPIGNNPGNGIGDMLAVNNLSDLANLQTALNNLLATTQARFASGTAAAPRIAFASDTDTGIYSFAANELGVALFGTARLRLYASGTETRFANPTANGGFFAFSETGALFANAGGTNQNITLTPSGTGSVVNQGVTRLNDSTYLGTFGSLNWGSSSLSIRATTGNALNLEVNGSSSASSGIRITVGGSSLFGTSTDSANGRIQLASHTTSAGGIGLGTDLSIYRSAANTLSFDGTMPAIKLRSGGTELGNWQIGAGNAVELGTATAASLILRTNNTAALTLDASQNAMFASAVWAGAATTLGWHGRSRLLAPSDGVVLLQNNASTDFGRLQFGGTTNSFPALKGSGSSLQVSLADDSALTNLRAGRYFITSGDVAWHAGTGSPEAVVSAGVGSLYSRTEGGAGTTLYVKQSGTGNTGWAAVTP